MLTEIYCRLDDFAKEHYQEIMEDLQSEMFQKVRARSRLTLPEVGTILTAYHFSNYIDFKHYYLDHVCVHLKKDFPDLVSYNRFIELVPACFPLLGRFLEHLCTLSRRTGAYFIDSTKLEACHIARAHQNKVSFAYAQKGKTSTGWFYGFKLHLVINHHGELVSTAMTRGGCADNHPVLLHSLTKGLSGIAYGDKGYAMNGEKANFINRDDFWLLAKPKKGKASERYRQETPVQAKKMHGKRGTVESVIDIQKNSMSLWNTRYRKFINIFVHLFAGLCAYCFRADKPSASLDWEQVLLQAHIV